MKSISLLFCLLSLSLFAEVRMDSFNMEKARTIAQQIAYRAMLNSHLENHEIIKKVYLKIGSVRFNTPDYGYDFTSCAPMTLAYVEMYKDPNTINLCHLSLIGSIEKLAQTLIHESAHLIGLEDECDASRVELLLFRLSRSPLVYKNNYLNQCGLDQSLRWFF